MGRNTKISWADHTLSPWWGCKKISPGCDNCYAAAFDKRFGGNYWDDGVIPRRTKPENWRMPVAYNTNAYHTDRRARVFAGSMCDIFDNRVPVSWRADFWRLVRDTPNIDWLLLTKRIGNAKAMLPLDWGKGWPNVWMMATVVNQEEADRDIPKLLDVPAVVHGLSVEPMLEKIIIDPDLLRRINWVICGQESGPGRRAFDEDWARSLRDQCRDIHTDPYDEEDEPAFFYKQKIVNGKKVELPALDGVVHDKLPWRHMI